MGLLSVVPFWWSTFAALTTNHHGIYYSQTLIILHSNIWIFSFESQIKLNSIVHDIKRSIANQKRLFLFFVCFRLIMFNEIDWLKEQSIEFCLLVSTLIRLVWKKKQNKKFCVAHFESLSNIQNRTNEWIRLFHEITKTKHSQTQQWDEKQKCEYKTTVNSTQHTKCEWEQLLMQIFDARYIYQSIDFISGNFFH